MARLARTVLLLALGTACAPHGLGGGFDDGPQIGEHGISVPVPPPSLTAAPKQLLLIEGELGYSDPEPMTDVYLFETVSEATDWAIARSDGTFVFDPGEPIDLTNNCFEVWSEEPGAYGEMSVHSFYRATIAEDDQTILTVQLFGGC
jgi:hypothetical protein